MDKILRELEKQAILGDSAAQRQLDLARMRAGQAPSFEYIVDLIHIANTAKGKYLYPATKALIEGYISQYKDIILRVSLDTGLDEQLIPYWNTDGLIVEVKDNFYLEDIHFTDDLSHEFEGRSIVYHLTQKCSCAKKNQSTRISSCYCDDDDFEELSDGQKSRFINLLNDGYILFKKLDMIDWGSIYSDEVYTFSTD